jgi:hypothetical protein
MSDRNAATAGKSAKQEAAKVDDGKAVSRDKSSNTAASGNQKTPAKKRRKVNHGTFLNTYIPLSEQVFVVLRHAPVGETVLGLGVSVMILGYLIVVVIKRVSGYYQSIRQTVNMLTPYPGNKAYHGAYIHVRQETLG